MAWYNNNKAVTHVASYKNATEAAKETELAARCGWTPHGTSATAGIIVITYTRSPEWYAAREKTQQSILELDSRIRSKEPALFAAQAARNGAANVESRRRTEVKSVEKRIAGIGTEVLNKAGAAYLNRQSLDRGTVELGHEDIRFIGWGGRTKIPLVHIRTVVMGRSAVMPRAGIPIIQHVWAGRPRRGDALLLTVQQNEQSPKQLMVFSDLRNGSELQKSIEAQQSRSGDVAAKRADLQQQLDLASANLRQASKLLGLAQSELDPIERDMKDLKSERSKLVASLG